MTEHRPNGFESPQAAENPAPAAPGQIETTPKKKMSTGVKAGIAGLAVLALGGGFALADPMNLMSGDEGKTAAVIPADVIGYSSVNLNPELSQKAEMVRFAMKFPGLKEKVNLTEGGDLKQELWTSMSKDSTCLKEINYDADIKPWLGDRMVMAVRSGAKSPIMAIEAKDEAKARAGYEKLNNCDKGNDKLTGLAFSDGYLVAAKTQEDADKAIADAKANPLEKKAEFSEDLKKLGDTGLLTMWGSKDGLIQLAESSDIGDKVAQSSPAGTVTPDPVDQLKQADFRSGAATLRFAGGNPEFHMVAKSEKDMPKVEASTKVGDLPGDTTVAIGIADGANQVDKQWDVIKKAIEQDGTTKLSDIEQQTKLKLPDDLKTLLGKDIRISVGKLNPEQIQSPADLPIAIAMDTDKAKIEELLTRTGLGSQGLQVSGSDTAPVVAISTDWATKVTNPGGKLSDEAGYKAAIANPGKAQSVVYWNLDAYKDLITKDMSSSEKANVDPLQAIGVSSQIEDDNYSAMTMRVTAK